MKKAIPIVIILCATLLNACTNSKGPAFPQVGKYYNICFYSENPPVYFDRSTVKIIENSSNGWAKVIFYHDTTPRDIRDKYSKQRKTVPENERIYSEVKRWLNFDFVIMSYEIENFNLTIKK